MDYKEKYEHGVECIQEILSGAGDLIKTSILRKRLQPFFPELKESEDERIRKAIHIYLDWLDGRKDYAPKGSYSIKDMITWLEKQGEQTHAELSQQEVTKTSDQEPPDKVEPKFKVGDWIVGNDGTFKITQYEDEYGYELTDTTGCVVHFISPNYVESNFHLWTIADAKVGDMLANDKNILFLKELGYDWSCNGTPNSVKAYCGIKPNGNFELGKDNWCFCGTLYIHPATKEQRDTLFAKMEESGYEWDADKKELKKIEVKTLDAVKLYDEVTKPHWISVEDELPPMRDENGTSDIVLTHTKGGGIYFNRYDYKGNTWGDPLAFNITYWMSLPQPPTVAENATVKEKGGEE